LLCKNLPCSARNFLALEEASLLRKKHTRASRNRHRPGPSVCQV
jgi:hypothetical protein